MIFTVTERRCQLALASLCGILAPTLTYGLAPRKHGAMQQLHHDIDGMGLRNKLRIDAVFKQPGSVMTAAASAEK